MVQAAKVRGAERMMIGVEASYDGLRVSFADGLVSVAPWESVAGVVSQAEVVSIEVDTPYEAVIRTRGGDEVEIPWDFARHFGDAEYRNRMAEETLRGQRKFGERLRRLRREADLSQQRLADLSGVGRVTIARIEGAAQSPKLDTIQKLAAGMGYPVQALLMDNWADFANDGVG